MTPRAPASSRDDPFVPRCQLGRRAAAQQARACEIQEIQEIWDT
jgi:hypothetical protein